MLQIIQWRVAHLWQVHARRNNGSNMHGAQLYLACTEYHFELACDLVSLKAIFSHHDCYISSKQFPTYSITCLYKSILEIFIRGSMS